MWCIQMTPSWPSFASSIHTHCSSYGVSTSGTTTPEVALWDFTRAAWVPLDGIQYGVQTIEAPERFVGAGGELRAQLTNRTPDTLNVTSLEFTLTVEP